MTLRREDVVLDADQNQTLLGVITNESDRLARTVNAILLGEPSRHRRALDDD